MMKRKNMLSLTFLSIFFLAYGQLEYEAKEYLNNAGETLLYRMLSPQKQVPDTHYPLVLFLHGSGERGANNISQLKHGGMMFTNPVNRERYPSYVIFPQCPEEEIWAAAPPSFSEEANRPLRLTKELIDNILKSYPIDTNRIYVVGLSMGGMGTFDLVCRYPHLFAAAIPICGGVKTERLRKIKTDTRLRIYHGDADDIVPVAFSRDAYKALQESGKEVEYNEFPGVKHNSWDAAFNMSDFMEWLYGQSK